MTPREKIREQARKNYPNTKTHPMESASFCGFTAGGAYGYNLAMEQACEYLKRFVCTSDVIETNEKGEPLADSFVEVSKRRLEAEKAFIEDFKQAMKL